MSATPKAYNVVYDAESGLQYEFATGYIAIPEAPLNAITSLTGQVTATGPGAAAATILNSAVIGKVLTGYTSGAGTVAATDTILQAIQKLNGNNALNLPLTGGTLTGDLIISTGASVDASVTLTSNGTSGVFTVDHTTGKLNIDVGGFRAFSINPGSGAISLANYTFDGASQPIRTSATLSAGGAPDASAILTATSTTQGFLPPRMNTTQRDAIASPAEGLVIHNTTTHKLNEYDGSAWVELGSSSPSVINIVADQSVVQFSTASTSFTSTGLTTTITPSSVTSKILVQVSTSVVVAAGATVHAGLDRGGSTLGGSDGGSQMWVESSSTRTIFPLSMVYLDSPATTSPVDYSLLIKTDTGTVFVGDTNVVQSLIVTEIIQ